MSQPTHPIRNGIIIGVAVASILGLWALLPSVFRWMGNLIGQAWSYLLGTYTLPRWFLFLVVLLALPTVLRILNSFRRKTAGEDDVKAYETDMFFGVRWRWDNNFHGQPRNLVAFCPSDDTQLVYSEDHAPDRTWLTCEDCGRRFYEQEGNHEYAWSRIYRLIDRENRKRLNKNAEDSPPSLE